MAAAPYRTYSLQQILTEFLKRGFREPDRSAEKELLFLKWACSPTKRVINAWEAYDKQTYAVVIEAPDSIPDGIPVGDSVGLSGNAELDYFSFVLMTVMNDEIKNGVVKPFCLDDYCKKKEPVKQEKKRRR